MVGFKFGKGVSKKDNNKEYFFVDVYFTETWYKRMFLSKKQYDILSSKTITVIE